MNYITQEEAINKAYEAGWVESASWAKRDDLIADINSPAYLANRRAALAQSARATELMEAFKDAPTPHISGALMCLGSC